MNNFTKRKINNPTIKHEVIEAKKTVILDKPKIITPPLQYCITRQVIIQHHKKAIYFQKYPLMDEHK